MLNNNKGVGAMFNEMMKTVLGNDEENKE